MRIQRCAPWAVGVLLATGLPLFAADQDEAKNIIDKAIKAHGGQEKLAKLKAVTLRFRGTIHQGGMDIPFIGEIVSQGSDQSRTALEADMNGMKVTIVRVLDREKGWIKFNDATEEMKPDQFIEVKEAAYVSWITRLAPLKENAFTLSSVGEVKVENRPALGVRVSSKGHRDVNLYFDKETSLLVKTEMRVKDDQTGMEVSQEGIHSDFKDINGMKEAMKIVVKRNDKPVVEATVDEVKREEKVDDSVFSKP